MTIYNNYYPLISIAEKELLVLAEYTALASPL
jgi:hypothetical protein